MPRKRWLTRLSCTSVIKPKDGTDADLVLVRTVLDKFEEVAALPGEVRDRLVGDLVDAIRFARAGIRAGQRHVSDRRIEGHIFLADIARTMTQAGLPVGRWSKHDLGEGESLFYQVAHALAAAAGLQLPRTLKEPAAQAVRITYGVMSPTMKAAQAAGHGPPGRHLTVIAGADHEPGPDAPRTCAELACAHPGFPF
jgi:hypothetical protein